MRNKNTYLEYRSVKSIAGYAESKKRFEAVAAKIEEHKGALESLARKVGISLYGGVI